MLEIISLKTLTYQDVGQHCKSNPPHTNMASDLFATKLRANSGDFFHSYLSIEK